MASAVCVNKNGRLFGLRWLSWSNPFGYISPELSGVPKATQERAQLFQVAGHGHESQMRYLLCVWVHARDRNRVTQEIRVRCAERAY